MGTRMTCEEYRAALVDHRGGDRDAPDPVAFEAHRTACPSCAEEARRDEWLVKALSTMPEDAPPPTTWAQVLAGQRDSRPAPSRADLRPRLAIAFATATAVAALMWADPFGQPAPGPGPVVTRPGTGAAVASEISPFTGAHALLSASDTTGDPNRHILLLYSVPAGDG